MIETVINVIGRFHPLIVHFPIALLLIAALFELLTFQKKWQGLRDGIILLVYVGSLSAVISSLCGYLLSLSENTSGETLDLHFYFGLSATALAIITSALLYVSSKRNYESLLWYRTILFTSVLLVAITGHFGGSLTHGEGYLLDAFQANESDYDIGSVIALENELNKSDTLSTSQLEKLNLEVRGILAHNCYQCHSEYKKKGGLALDSKRAVFDGGENGKIIIEGLPQQSELSKRINLPSNHKDVMPKKGKTLQEAEIALIDLWIEKGAYWSDQALETFPEAPLALIKPEIQIGKNHTNPIDQIIDDYFEGKGLKWPSTIQDEAFIRRVHLDITGLLPSPDLIRDFVSNNDVSKRENLIDELLADDRDYTEHWLSFWNDLLRNDYSGPGFITGGRKEITPWLYDALLTNKSYDEMVRELVNPDEESEGFIKGIQWRGVVNASQRTEMQAAQNIGQSLMGVNVKCASCHNSFVSNVTLKQAYGFASIFAEEPLELNRCDKPTGVLSKVSFLYNELGSVEAETIDERLDLLSEVMVQPQNGRLYRTFTNRIWKNLMGRGLVEPVDEMDEAPWSQELLDWLSADFVESGTNIKHLLKQIMNSKAYQLTADKAEDKQDLISKNYVFQGPLLRRLSAEQFTDAVSQVISPMFYGVGYDPSDEGLSARRIWHRERKFDRDVLPEPGIRYFRHTFELEAKDVESAQALLSVDHSFTFYLNGKKIAEESDWRKVSKLNVTNHLKQGPNTIALKASNEGKIANPAGILMALRVNFNDGSSRLLEANKKWLSTDKEPDPSWLDNSFIDTTWLKVKDYGAKNWDKLLDFKFDSENERFARASLVKQHPFLKALGRPSRENVTTYRDPQATLLQALELTNGSFLSTVLYEGAINWQRDYGENVDKMLDQVFQELLGRLPTSAEKRSIKSTIGKDPSLEDIQDLFWALLLLPEFQFIS